MALVITGKRKERCETCKHWDRFKPGMPFGKCWLPMTFLQTGEAATLESGRHIVAGAIAILTTDLTLCSGYEEKQQ